MHGKIYQIGTKPIDSDDYVDIDVISEGEMVCFDYLDDTEPMERKHLIRAFVDNTLPKGMFTVDADGETLTYQGGFAEWKKQYIELLHNRVAAIDETNIMDWLGPTRQLQKAIVNPLNTDVYFVVDFGNGYATADRSRDFMYIVKDLEPGAKLYIGAILDYHA